MDWWIKICEHCGQRFSKGWGHSCLDEGVTVFRDGFGQLRPDLDPVHGSAGLTDEEYQELEARR